MCAMTTFTQHPPQESKFFAALIEDRTIGAPQRKHHHNNNDTDDDNNSNTNYDNNINSTRHIHTYTIAIKDNIYQ